MSNQQIVESALDRVRNLLANAEADARANNFDEVYAELEEIEKDLEKIKL